MRNEFSTFDIVNALGIPFGRLREWINEGFIKPNIPAEGAGTKAIFTRDDVYGVALFKSLVEFGMKRKRAAEFVEMGLQELPTRSSVKRHVDMALSAF